MSKRQVHPFAFVASIGVVALPVSVVGLLLTPLPPWREALLGLIAGGIFIAAVWLYFTTVAREDISRLEPLMRLTSVQTLLLGALFLGNSLNVCQGLAFGAMLVSSLLLSLKPDRGGMTINRAALRVLPATTLLAINGVLMAQVYRATSVWSGMVWEHLGIVIAVVLVARKAAPCGGLGWNIADRRMWGMLIAGQIIGLVSAIAPASAAAHGVPVALLSALNGIRPAWVWLLAVLVLKERVRRADIPLKGGGMIVMAMGVYWLL